MNDKFLDMLDKFVSIYIDDILVYSNTRKEYQQHVRLVLQRLRELGLRADIKKCEFGVTEVKFLGLIITEGGVKMDQSKVSTILNWETPKDLKGYRRFMGFVNYYRRFIRNFSGLTKPITNLFKKNAGPWDASCDEAFEALKQEVAKEPIMRHFDYSREAFIKCDSSNTITAGVLSQKDDKGQLHPVAYFSASLGPAERNYAIYDKELLAIIRYFEEWRPELQSASDAMPTRVLTDHKSLEYFMTTKKLSRRQARWAELLSQYNFKIDYRPGAANGKADALTRREDSDVSRAKEDPNLNQTMLTKTMLSDKILKDLNIAKLVLEAANTANIARLGSKPKVCPATKAEIDVIDSDRVQTFDRHENRSESVTNGDELIT